MRRLSCYYAHCIALYGTRQEARDVALLESLGFYVDNPNRPEVDEEVKRRKAAGDPDYMEYFRTLVEEADLLAFRALPDGAIPSGVAKEIAYAIEAGVPVIELPSALGRRTISLEQTREYLYEVGQR